MRMANLDERFTCAVCSGLRTWHGQTCTHCAASGSSTLRADVESSISNIFDLEFNAHPARDRDIALALQSAREMAAAALKEHYEYRHGAIHGSFDDERLRFTCSQHLCDDSDDQNCCKECCGVGTGGCTCDHDCDKMCLDSCPRWLAARRKERS